ncbi:uncharacterized protein [Parasteatoda tepidariorum]|uniref:uncharacterized protein n=1 Tax=Parasteatoda tepidariorum TaxID=114398 RepID=UPI0039BD65F0
MTPWMSNVSLVIKFNAFRLNELFSVPRIQPTELISSFGGCLGMWIGASIIDTLDVLTCIMLALYYKFSSRKKRIKKLRSMKCHTMRKRLSIYAVLKNAYIRSMSDVVLVKSKKERLVKMSVFLLSVGGFLYHSLYLTKLYLSYEATMNEFISRPSIIQRPAITICNSNTRNRKNVCLEHPSKCTFLKSEEELCEKYPLYCTPDPNERFLGVLNGSYECRNDCPSWEKIRNESENVLTTCLDESLGKETKCTKDDFLEVAFTTHEGQPTICYTYGSQISKLYSKDGDPKISLRKNISYMSTSHAIRVSFMIPTDKYLDSTETPAIYMAVHDPRRLVNPFREGLKLEARSVNVVNIIGMLEQKLLPSPYVTNCTDYIGMWNKNKGKGPLDTAECIAYCQFDVLKKERRCIPRNLGLSHTSPLCREGESVSQNILEFCLTQCGIPCLYQYYQQDLEIEAVKLSDFYSNVGGYLGIWIGVSLISIMDLLRRIVSLLVLCVRKRKKSKKIFLRVPRRMSKF